MRICLARECLSVGGSCCALARPHYTRVCVYTLCIWKYLWLFVIFARCFACVCAMLCTAHRCTLLGRKWRSSVHTLTAPPLRTARWLRRAAQLRRLFACTAATAAYIRLTSLRVRAGARTQYKAKLATLCAHTHIYIHRLPAAARPR